MILDPKILKHHKVNWSKVRKYAKLMYEGEIFPPIEVCLHKGNYIVCNGAHRTEACILLGLPIYAVLVDRNDIPTKVLPIRWL